ncbi:MAG: PLP-dependent aminotransferase family protein, partial [Clostridiales bacterium]|jgi:DNA-binding transcriptional MocR family regulator|nr:PLP-dependent aminotransferase family protein [Clostridiales bacterium]
LSRGAQVIEIDMEDDGMDLDRLEALMKVMRPKFIYMTSYFQTPTCVSYSNDKKQRLLNLALKYDTFILEEDNQSEFVYNDEKVVPIKSLDYKNRVMYVKSFSKSIMPGLRIGFMALPKKIMNKVISAKYTTDIATSGFIQRAFELFLSSGDYDRHINDMRTVFKLRFNKACADINKYLLEYVDYNMPIGGVNIWLKLKNKQISSEGLSNLLVKDNVIITPGALFSSSGEDIPYFRLSVSSVGVENITGGIKKIGKCLKEMS